MSKESNKALETTEAMAPVVSHNIGQVDDCNGPVRDAVFGEISGEGPNYRNVGWLGTAVLMLKTQIGLGVLSLPSFFHTVGIIPGVIIIIVIAVITTWSGYVVGTFKIRHPQVYGVADVGQLIFGPIGRELMYITFALFFILAAGSGMISISIALNAISTHGACTAVFVAVAAIIGFCFASIQTLGHISWLAWVGVTSIMTGVLTVAIAVGVEGRPALAPKQGLWKSDYKLFASPSFTDAVAATSTIVFAYAGTPAFFPIVAEMRNPRDYVKSLIASQSFLTIVYVVIGTVVYYYCGSYVSSPALGSAGPIVKKVAYGLGLPGLIVSITLSLHFTAKHVFVRILRRSRHLSQNTIVHWATWLGSVFGIVVVAYVIASGVPIFNGLISLAGALLGTFLSFQPMGCMWLYDNWKSGKAQPTLKWYFLVAWSVFVIISGTFLTVAGSYSSIVSIIDTYHKSGPSPSWACADNSGSV